MVRLGENAAMTLRCSTLIMMMMILVATVTCQTYIRLEACSESRSPEHGGGAPEQGPPGKMGPQGRPGNRGPVGAKGSKGTKGDVGDLPEDVRAFRGDLDALADSLAKVVSVVEDLKTQLASITRDLYPSFKIVATETRQSWEASKDACRSLGGNILSVAMTRGKDEGFYFREIFKLSYAVGWLWIDITDQHEEGSWKTSSGTSFDELIFGWGHGEPNGGRRANCGGLHNGVFYSDICSYNRRALCEIPTA